MGSAATFGGLAMSPADHASAFRSALEIWSGPTVFRLTLCAVVIVWTDHTGLKYRVLNVLQRVFAGRVLILQRHYIRWTLGHRAKQSLSDAEKKCPCFGSQLSALKIAITGTRDNSVGSFLIKVKQHKAWANID